MKQAITIFWFRRDLRLEDNAGLYHALKDHDNVLPVFIFDRSILDRLEDRKDRRVQFIHSQILNLHEQLTALGSGLMVLVDTPEAAFERLLALYDIAAVYANTDYEPYAVQRDATIKALLLSHGGDFFSFKDQVIFEKDEVVKEGGDPYTVFTPYSKRWKSRITEFFLTPYPVHRYLSHLIKIKVPEPPALESVGFKFVVNEFPDREVTVGLIVDYSRTRDFPGVRGTSRLSVHLRFGTISIRQLVSQTRNLNETFLNELIWREFYMMILWHFPHVVHKAFKPEYDDINWINDKGEFEKWCSGQTGYPIVDAGMRELAATGYMHNRVRMVTASFLCKHLLIDWRWGEAWFAQKLLDFDLAANNGGWQWSAGTGCDAAPYFRVFNPYLQTQKFDPQLTYVRKWVPEYGTPEYPDPIVDHALARTRCLAAYKSALEADQKTVHTSSKYDNLIQV